MIEIWTEELPKGWEWEPDNYLGGTPEFIVNTAECISKDHDVIVYYDGPSKLHNGVYYVGRSSFKGDEIVLSCNSKAPIMGKYNIYWSNWFHQRAENCMEFDERIVLSPYHKSIFGDDSRMVPHSLWPDQFKDPLKIKRRCLYSSSPDRGADFINSIWDDVHEATGAELIMTYNKSIPEQEMIELYKSSQFWLHAGQGVELFCIAAAKAQVAGCIPVVVPNMALETTVKYGVKVSKEEYKDALIDAINFPPKVEEVDFGDWNKATDELFINMI